MGVRREEAVHRGTDGGFLKEEVVPLFQTDFTVGISDTPSVMQPPRGAEIRSKRCRVCRGQAPCVDAERDGA